MALAGYAVRLRQSKSGTTVSVKSLAHTRRARRGRPPRGARRSGRPDRRPGRLADIGRPIRRHGARRHGPARRARHDPPGPPPTPDPRRRHAHRTEPRRGHGHRRWPRGRPVRGARGRAAPRRRGRGWPSWPIVFDADPALEAAPTGASSRRPSPCWPQAGAGARVDRAARRRRSRTTTSRPTDERRRDLDDRRRRPRTPSADGEPEAPCRTSADFMAIPTTTDDSVQSPEPPDDARLVVGKSPGRHGRGSRRRGRPQGPALPPRPDARARGRDARRHRHRGAPRDAGRHPPPARRVARLRRVVPAGPDQAVPERPARDRRRASGPCATSTSCSRRSTCTGRTCRPPRARPSSRCSRDWRGRRDDARVLLDPRARLAELPALGRRLPRLRPDRGRRGHPGRADPAAPRPRHRAVADLGRLRAGPRLRARPALGRRRDAPRAADRREVAALHARVRARGARAGGHAAAGPGHGAPGPPRA